MVISLLPQFNGIIDGFSALGSIATGIGDTGTSSLFMTVAADAMTGAIKLVTNQ
jgi:hypothetical protein